MGDPNDPNDPPPPPPGAPLPPTRLIDPTGVVHDVPAASVPSALQLGWTAPTEEQRIAGVAQAARQADYGGVSGGIGAGLTAGLRGATLGASDAVIRALGDDNSAFDLRQLKEENPGITKASDVAGTALLTAITGGASAALRGAGGAAALGAEAAAGAGEAGAAAAAAGGEAGGGLLAQLGRSAATGAAEGAVFGAGGAVSDLAMEEDPLTWEHAASTLSSNMLYGALTGGVVGAAGKGLELGLVRAKNTIDAVLERGAARTAALAAEPDIATMTSRQLREAREAEEAALDAAREPEREALVDDLRTVREEMQDAEPWKLASGSPNKYTREGGAQARRADTAIRTLLNKRAKLARDPQPLLEALETQRQAYGDMLESAKTELAAYKNEFENVPSIIRNDIIAPEQKEWRGGLMQPPGRIKDEIGPFTPAGVDQAVAREMIRRYGSLRNPVFPERFNLIPEVEATLEKNAKLTAQLESALAPSTSPRLSRLDEALEDLHAPKPEKEAGVGDLAKTLIKAVPFTGPLHAATEIGGKVTEAFKKVTAKVAERTLKATSAFLAPASKAAKLASAYGPVAATKLLADVRYAPPDVVHGSRAYDDPTPRPQPKNDGEKLAHVYEDRTAEIRAMTAYDEMGTPRLRPEARASMASQLNALRPQLPVLADRVETIATRRLEYLSSIMPRRPEIGGTPLGPDDYRPSDMEMREFARAAAAIEDPVSVLEKAAHGIVVPEEVRAIAAVYPEMLASWTRGVMTEYTTKRTKLPIERRLSLSIMAGVPVDPSMEPHIMSTLQAQYQYEPGPQQAKPQFGSVKKDSADTGTPSQRREEGTGT